MSRAGRKGALVAAVLSVSLVCAPVLAQDAPLPDERPDLKDMTDEELRRFGFQWEAQTAVRGSVVAGLLASIPGLAIHGLGHFTLGDYETGWTLLTTEGIGLALVAAGLLTFATADTSEVLEEFGIGIGQFGLVLFGASYLSDVIGSIRGTDPLPLLIVQDRLLSGEVSYRFVVPGDLPTLNLLEARLGLDLGVVQLEPWFYQDVLLGYRQFGLSLMLKPVQGRQIHDYLGFRVRAGRADLGDETALDFIEGNEAVTHVDLSVELSLDLGRLLDHLKNTTNIVSFGAGFVGDSGARAALPGTETRAYFVLEELMRLNINRFVGLEAFYIFNESELVSPFARALGVLGTRLRVFPSDELEVFVEGEVGTGASLGAGLIWFGP